MKRRWMSSNSCGLLKERYRYEQVCSRRRPASRCQIRARQSTIHGYLTSSVSTQTISHAPSPVSFRVSDVFQVKPPGPRTSTR